MDNVIKQEYNPNYKYGVGTVVETGQIPETLANLTIQLLQLHHLNGDLGWVEDLIKDIKAGTI